MAKILPYLNSKIFKFSCDLDIKRKGNYLAKHMAVNIDLNVF